MIPTVVHVHFPERLCPLFTFHLFLFLFLFFSFVLSSAGFFPSDDGLSTNYSANNKREM